LGLAEIYSSLNKHTESIQVLKKALYLDPTDYYTIYEIGREYHKLGNLDEAIKYYYQASPGLPQNHWLFYWLAKALDEQNKLNEAEKIYLKTLQINPKHKFTLLRLAQLNEKKR
jgi:tetratricopeptide (TPR) repeat protein